jgi:hypothetical protein
MNDVAVVGQNKTAVFFADVNLQSIIVTVEVRRCV